MTVNLAVKFNDAAEFDAEQVKLPEWPPVTESIFNTEFLLPSFTVVIPEYSFTGLPLKYHRNEIGKSPDVTKHCTLAESPKFDGLSPKLKCAIDGGTNFH